MIDSALIEEKEDELPDTAPLVDKPLTTQELLAMGDIITAPIAILESLTSEAEQTPLTFRVLIQRCTIQEDSSVKQGVLYLDVELLRQCVSRVTPKPKEGYDRPNPKVLTANLKLLAFFYDRIRQTTLKDQVSPSDLETWEEIRTLLEQKLNEFIIAYPNLISTIENPDTAVLLEGTGIINTMNQYKEHEELDSRTIHAMINLTKRLIKTCLKEDTAQISPVKLSFALSIITWLQSETIVDLIDQVDPKLVQILRSKVLSNMLLEKLQELTFSGLNPENLGHVSTSHNIAHSLNNIVLRRHQVSSASEQPLTYEKEQAIAFGVKGLIEYGLRNHLISTSIIPELVDELNKATNSNLGEIFWEYTPKKNRTIVTRSVEVADTETAEI